MTTSNDNGLPKPIGMPNLDVAYSGVAAWIRDQGKEHRVPASFFQKVRKTPRKECSKLRGKGEEEEERQERKSKDKIN